MKYIEEETGGPAAGLPVLELTERNLRALLEKLSDPLSHRTLIDSEEKIAVRAVSDDAHYKTRSPGINLTNERYT